MYCPVPNEYSPYPFEAVKLACGKNGLNPFELDELYSTLKYCGDNALSFWTPPNEELNLATPLKEKVSPLLKDDVIICDISYALLAE